MRIQLDTINKTITIEEDVNLHDFYEQINGLLPGGPWREFTLKVTKITEWKDPINVPSPTTPINPFPQHDPWTQPYGPSRTYPGTDIWYTTNTDINCTIGVDGVELNNGTYNIEVK